jgi:hypothetical protein
MIDVKIDLRQQGTVWELVACSVELHDQHVPVLYIPPRLDETFATKEAAVATMKERVTIELQHNNRHESGNDVKWQIRIHPTKSSIS